MGAGVHVIHKNNDIFIVRAGDTNDNVRISTAGQFSHVFCDATVGRVCPLLAEGCLGIDLLLILIFLLGGEKVIDEATDDEI